MMLDLQHVRELLGKPDLSDSEAEAIRATCRIWAEIVVETIEYLSSCQKEDSATGPPNGEKDIDQMPASWYKSNNEGNHLHTGEQ